jgi:hypothetical protein
MEIMVVYVVLLTHLLTLLNMSLSNMCNIAHVKVTKNSNFFKKNNNYLLKIYSFNVKCTSSNAKLLF